MNADVLGYEGRRVVVTGGSSGMGEATARIAGELGAEVVIVDVREPSAPCAEFHQTDLRDKESIERTVSAIVGSGSRVEKLFNCAGIPHTFGPVDCMLVNFVGLRHFAEAMIPHLADGGAIASIASGAGIGYLANMANVGALLAVTDFDEARQWCEEHPDEIREGYSFSKECIIVWTMARAMPLAAERRIRINCIGPGPTDTAFMGPTIEELGADYFEAFPMPLFGRMSTPEEQAWPLIFCNSDMASVVTGTCLWTDQGFAGGLFTGQVDVAKLMPTMPDGG